MSHRDYFNALADRWHEKMPPDPSLITYLHKFGIQTGDRVLDIGAGTGRMTGYLAELVGPYGLVVAQDIAENMIFEALQHVHLSPAVNFLCDDAHSLSIQDGVFDKVLCFSAFPHFIDKIRVISEWIRVLKPNGKLLILHNAGSDQINTFHQSLQGIVSNDRLPSIADSVQMLKSFNLTNITSKETPRLYWIEGTK